MLLRELDNTHGVLRSRTLIMMLLAVLASALMQDPIDAVAASEARRVAVIDRCAKAVCSVMSMDSPGGGSGVIFDPAGFVLTILFVLASISASYGVSQHQLNRHEAKLAEVEDATQWVQREVLVALVGIRAVLVVGIRAVRLG